MNSPFLSNPLTPWVMENPLCNFEISNKKGYSLRNQNKIPTRIIKKRRNSLMQNLAQLTADGKELKERQKDLVKRLLEESLQEEMRELIGSEHWEHNQDRTTYRNGFYPRGLLTDRGYISDIKVPRARKGGIEFQTIEKYQQRTKDVDRIVKNMFLQGISTRKVEEALEPLWGSRAVSSTTVSNITKALDKEVFKYHNRKVKDEYQYLLFDGIYLNCKSPVHKTRRCILVKT